MYRVPSKEEGRRILKEIALVLSEDDNFVDASTHKVISFFSQGKYISLAALYASHLTNWDVRHVSCYSSKISALLTDCLHLHSGLSNQEGKRTWGERMLLQCKSLVWWAPWPSPSSGDYAFSCWNPHWEWLPQGREAWNGAEDECLPLNQKSHFPLPPHNSFLPRL